MLLSLTLDNFLTFEKFHQDFQEGLIVFTGETGAGKSIVMDAIGIALGDRASPSFIRHSQPLCSIVAVFNVSSLPQLMKKIEGAGFVLDDALYLKRIIKSDGKSRAFLNDLPVSAQFLQEIRPLLVDIHTQFDQISSPKSQQEILDKTLPAAAQSPLKNCKEAFIHWRESSDTFLEKKKNFETLRHQKESIESSIRELEILDVKENEEDELLSNRQTVMNLDKVIGAFQYVEALHGESHVEETILEAISRLQPLTENDKTTEEIHTVLETGLSLIREAANLAGKALNDKDPETLPTIDEIEERLFSLRNAARKFHVFPNDLPSKLIELREELSLISSGEEGLDTLELQVKKNEQTYLEQAKKLHEFREKHALEIQEKVQGYLPHLKLENARFEIKCSLQEGEYSYTPRGLTHIEFQVSTNPGTPLSPIKKTASGGELSRLALALKAALFARSDLPTMVFDEIDKGVSGAVAAAVGRMLNELSKHTQVLCITHAPQVAAHGTHHFSVRKKTTEKASITTIQPLMTPQERIEEIAQMISGHKVSPESLEAAKSLIENCHA